MPFPFGQFGKFWFVRHMSEQAAAQDAARGAAQQDGARALGVIATCPHCGRCVQTYADETLLVCVDGSRHELSSSPTAPARTAESFPCE